MSDTPRLPDPPPDRNASLSDLPASPNGQAPPPPARAPARRRNRRWVWFFAVLALLTVAATVTLIVYNLSQQLTREELAKARKLWEEKGPKDYEFRYTTRYGEDREDHYAVVVRGGQVRSVTLNNTIHLPREKLRHYSMTALFDQIEDFLDLDSKSGRPKVYKVGRFSPADGHLVRYVRRVMGSRERLEIVVEQFKSEQK
jgi:hypothetical protein